MANAAFTQQVSTRLNSLKFRFNRKLAAILFLLLRHKSAGSLGALAGFAIGVLFTWKFLRSPLRLRKKQEGICPSSSGGAASPEDGATLSSNSSQQIHNGMDVVGDFHSPAKVALAQSVKKKLYGGRKMTCRLLGVILEENSPEELQEHATVRSSVVEVLLEVGSQCDIYLLERILDDDCEERVLSALGNAGLFKTGVLMKEKVLFCSTENGRSSFVRQLEPDWHIDTNTDIISQQSRFIRNQLHISPAGSSFAVGSNIFSSSSFELYFTECGAD